MEGLRKKIDPIPGMDFLKALSEVQRKIDEKEKKRQSQNGSSQNSLHDPYLQKYIKYKTKYINLK